MYRFQEEDERPKGESVGVFASKLARIESRMPSLIRESPPPKPMSYKQILNKLIGRSDPQKPLPDEKLINSVQKSDQSHKSKCKSSRRMPRVIDVFELYDRKKRMRGSR